MVGEWREWVGEGFSLPAATGDRRLSGPRRPLSRAGPGTHTVRGWPTLNLKLSGPPQESLPEACHLPQELPWGVGPGKV